MGVGKCWAIVNPRAGGGGQAEAALERLRAWGCDQIHQTQRSGEAEELAREAGEEGVELVIVAGGDGTVHQVINGLAPRFGAAVGIVPLGTGNDLARSLEIPLDAEEALACVERGRGKRLDVVRVQGLGAGRRGGESAVRYLANHATAGFSAVAGQNTQDAGKGRWGPLEYLRSAVASVAEASSYAVTLVIDEGERLEIDLYNLILCNGKTVAGGIPVAPEAKVDDGLLEVMAIPRATLPRLALLVPQILLGKHLGSEDLIHRQARRLRIQSGHELPFTVDGETLEWQPETLEVLPGAVEVRCGGRF